MRILAPTTNDILDGLLVLVNREHDEWNFGEDDIFEVYHRESDDTFWSVRYKVSCNGNELCKGHAIITRVVPRKKVMTIIEYEKFDGLEDFMNKG